MALPQSFTSVTPFSRLLALVLFILLPIATFYVGRSYGAPATSSTPALSCATKQSATPSCATQNQCSDEAKECPDGSFVFKEGKDCLFAACPSLRGSGTTPPVMPKTGATKENQITASLSQKTGIPQLDLLIVYKNTAENNNTFDGGTYSSKTEQVSGRWIAAKVNGSWMVTSISTGVPLCTDVTPYFYPKELVPACKDAKGNITAR